MDNLVQLVSQFRHAIEKAKDAGEFVKDIAFHKFPRGCCGDASDLLAQFLLENRITTYYVCGTYYGDSPEEHQTHAWLITNKHIVLDITGDQFKYDSTFLNFDTPVFVGKKSEFHNLFEYEEYSITKHNGIRGLGDGCQYRLNELYQKIIKYID